MCIRDRLVTALVSIIGGLANAISNHRSEIVEAINKLYEEVIRVVVELFARLMGVSKEKLSEISEYVLPWAKRIGLALIGIFAYKKIKGAADKAFSVFNTIKKIGPWFTRQLNNFKSGIWYIKEATKEAGSFGAALSGGYFNLGKVSGLLSKVAGVVAKHPIAIAAIAAGVAFKVMIDRSTEAMKVITENDRYIADATKEVREEEEKLNQVYSDRKESYSAIDTETKHTERLVGMLREMVDENNKVKAGYETRVGLIKQQLAGTLNVEVDAQSHVLTVINDQNEALDIQSKKVDEIVQKKRLQEKLEKAEAQAAEYREKIESGYYSKQEAAAIKAKNEWIKESHSFNIAMDADAEHPDGYVKTVTYTNEQLAHLYDEYRKLKREEENGELTGDTRWQYYDELKQMLSVENGLIDSYAAMTVLEHNIGTAHTNLTRAMSIVKNVDRAWEAMDGTLEQAKAAIAALDFDVVFTDAGASIQEVINEFEGFTNEIGELIDSGAYVPKETLDKYKELFTSIANNLGDSEEGRAYLNSVGYTNADEWLGGFSDRLKKETSSNEIEESVRQWFKEMGMNDVEGLIAGLKEKYGSLKAAYEDLAWTGLGEYAAIHDSHSPSRAFEKLGVYDVMGLIQGITSKEGALEKTYSAMAAGNIAAYTAAMSAGNSSMVFTPMINQAGIQNGTAAIQGQLNSLTATPLGATLTSQLAARVDTSQIDADHSNVLSAMNGIRDEILNLSDRLANLEVVMDTGATVGALAPAMDMELGRRTVRKARGV